jgi:hypothetical protein
MTEHEAFTLVIGPLAAMTSGWDDARINGWVDRLSSLNDTQAAHAAAQLVIDTHAEQGAPRWRAFLDAYRPIAARNMTERRGLLPERYEAITLSEYLRRLIARTDAGEPGAAEDLAVWRNLANASVDTLLPAAWRKTLSAHFADEGET